MIVYIEYALIENFLIDGGLLLFSLWLLKRRISLVKISLSALLGAGFALLYPLLSLPLFLSCLLKFSVGILLVLLASKKENSIGRYALNALSFFFVCFLFAGFLFAFNDLFSSKGEKISLGGLLGGSVIFSFLLAKFIKKLYFKRKINGFLYDCELFSGNNRLAVKGFLDSGNTASFNGAPVCFLSAKLLLDLIEVGQVCDEMQILTVNGEQKIKIFKIDKLWIYSLNGLNIIEKVYVSPTGNFQNGEYDLLLNGGILP